MQTRIMHNYVFNRNLDFIFFKFFKLCVGLPYTFIFINFVHLDMFTVLAISCLSTALLVISRVINTLSQKGCALDSQCDLFFVLAACYEIVSCSPRNEWH